jgi:hypothetical protein
MKKTSPLLTILLLTGFSANTVLAESSTVNVARQVEDSIANLKQTQRNITEVRSATIDAIIYGKKDVPSVNSNIKQPIKPANTKVILKTTIPDVDKRKKTAVEKLKERSKDKKPGPIPEIGEVENSTPVTSNSPKTVAANINTDKIVSVKTQVRINKKGILEVAKTGQRLSTNSGVRLVWKQASNAEMNRLFFIGRSITQLTPKQNALLKERLGAIVNSPNIKKFLITIRDAEFGEGLRIVGNGHGKPLWIQNKIKKLTYASHPREQLPIQAFYFHKKVKKYSTASGELQITYTNWRLYKKHFGFNDFSILNQRIAGLDLARGSHSGKGFKSVLKGGTGFRYGTQPWASSVDSTLPAGSKIDYNVHSQTAKVIRQIEKDKDV